MWPISPSTGIESGDLQRRWRRKRSSGQRSEPSERTQACEHFLCVEQAFAQRFERLRSDVDAGKPDAANALFEHLADWTKSHILAYDKKVAEYAISRKAA